MEIVKTLLEQYRNELALGKAKPRASAYNMDLIMSAISKAQRNLRKSGVCIIAHELEYMRAKVCGSVSVANYLPERQQISRKKGLRVALGMDEDGNLELNQPDVLVIEGLNESKI